MYRFVLSMNNVFLLLFAFFFSANLSAQTTTACAKYEVIPTNNICGCTDFQFRPYGLFVETNDTCGLNYFKPDTVVFEIRSDSSAAIRGVFRTFHTFRPIRVDITLEKAATGTPRFDLCLSGSPASVANQWRYFGAMSGTIQFDGGTPLSVGSRNGNFQVGLGANGQNPDQFGGSGFFILSNGQKGGFGFTLANPTNGSCVLSDSCQADTRPPVFSNCPQNISLTTTGTSAITTWTPPTAADNCSTPSVSSNYASGASFPVGTTTVIYTAKDAKNNTAECRFNVTVTRFDPCANDITPPVISNCPLNINVTTSGTNAVATWTPPTATDNCSTVTATSNFTPGASFPMGSTTVSYLFKDASNNISECRFNIIVTLLDPCATDITPPIFSNCPLNINLTTTGTNAVATWTAPTATDNCGTPSVTSNYASGASFPIGTTTVIYSAKDAKNNTAECRFNVTVTRFDPCANDITPPVISNCPLNINVTTSGTNAVATWTPPTATDNCSNVTATSNFTPGASFPMGSTTVSYLFKDASNNISECRFNVIVTFVDPCATDITPPIFSNCPLNINLTTAGTNAVVIWTAPTATDNCTTPSVTSNYASGTAFPIGTTTVIYTAKDAKNNTAECRFNVTVTKRIAVAGTCTSYAVENTNDICACPTRQWVPYGLFIETGVDCGDYYKADNVSFQINGDSSARLVGTFRTSTWRPVWLDIQWSKTNQTQRRFSTCANDTAASQNWRYFGTAQGNIQFDDEHPLSITNRSLLQVGMSANGQNGNLFGASGLVTLGDGRVGSINIVLNNPISSTCDLVCVNDTVPPRILNCPRNITQLSDQQLVAVTWAAPSVRDDCSSPVLTTTHLPGAVFAAGETTVIYTARDVSGNVGQCSFKVKIDKVASGSLCSSYDVDNTNDICGCSANQWKPYALRVGDGTCGSYFKADSVIFHVNGDSTAQLVGRFRSDTWQPIWVDVHFAKAGINNRNPRFELCQTNNPDASKWQYFGSMSGMVKFGDAPAIAIQAGSLLQIGKGANGQNTGIFGGNVGFTLADGSSASFNMVLTNYQQFVCPDFNPCAVDSIKPTFVNCPRDTNIVTAQTSAIVQWTAPTATDNCSTPSVTSNFTSGRSFPIGSTVVTYTATDVSNNTNQCRFTINVTQNICLADTTKPVFQTCPTFINVIATSDSAAAAWVLPTATDNCSPPSVTSNFRPGQNFPVGTTTVIYTAKDILGNTSQCRFPVTVTLNLCAIDRIPPVMTNCPDSVVVITSGTSAPVTWVTPTFTDNCSTPTITSNFPSGISFNLGSTIIIIKAWDAAGNTTQCTFKVIVKQLTAINEPNIAISAITIAPNPAVNQLNLNWQSRFSDDAQLEISNILGQVVLKQTVNMKIGENHLPIDVSSLIKGIYHLTLRNPQYAAPKAVRFMKI